MKKPRPVVQVLRRSPALKAAVETLAWAKCKLALLASEHADCGAGIVDLRACQKRIRREVRETEAICDSAAARILAIHAELRPENTRVLALSG